MRRSRCDPARFLSDILPFVNADGARNFNAVSQELSIPYQTFRARMDRLGELGLTIRPVLEASKFGMERARASFRLAPRSLGDQDTFFTRLNESAGLKYYARALVSQEFDTEFWVPSGKLGELSKLLSSLEDERVVSSPRIRRLLWKDYFMFKPKNFDYMHGEWDVDFSALAGDPSVRPPAIERAREERFDYYDLFIMKSIELKPWVKNMEVARQVGVSDADVSYHINAHVFEKKLISGFRLAWVGKREAWRRHTIMAVTLIFDSIGEEAARHAMSILSALPFAWNHSRGEHGYYVGELLVPIAHYVETMRYLSDHLRRADLRPSVLETDPSCVMGYTLPYKMYDRGAREWRFDADKALKYVLQVVEPRAKKAP